MSDLVDINIVSGVEGPSVYVAGLRVDGPKPWGGGSFLHQFKARRDDLLCALNLPHPDCPYRIPAHRAEAASPDALDEAWREVEAALPEGWWLHILHAWSFDDMAYRAEAASAGSQDYEDQFGTRTFQTGPSIDAYGPTPTAALQALTAKLTKDLPMTPDTAAILRGRSALSGTGEA